MIDRQKLVIDGHQSQAVEAYVILTITCDTKLTIKMFSLLEFHPVPSSICHLPIPYHLVLVMNRLRVPSIVLGAPYVTALFYTLLLTDCVSLDSIWTRIQR